MRQLALQSPLLDPEFFRVRMQRTSGRNSRNDGIDNQRNEPLQCHDKPRRRKSRACAMVLKRCQGT
jgi:hypothetical protein